MHKITTLENGLRIVTQNMPGLETMSMYEEKYLKKLNGIIYF